MDPVEPLLGPFLSPDIPPKGAQFQAQVRHLQTPNQVNRMIQERRYLISLHIFSAIVIIFFLVTIAFSNELN